MKLHALGAIALAVFAVFANAASPSRALEVDVDCAKGESIGAALERPVVFERRIVVTVRGTCSENIVIERDDVTLQAHASGGVIEAADAARPVIRVEGARRISIEGLAIRGGQHGVRLMGTAAAALRESVVRGAGQDGVRIEGGSSAIVDNTLVENNGHAGISARGAHLTLTRSTIRNNGISGVQAVRGSQAVLGGTEGDTACCGNTIEGHPIDGLTVADNAGAVLWDNIIQNNGAGTGPNTGRFGILVINTSTVRLFGGNKVRNNGSPNPQVGGGGILVRGGSLRSGPGDTPLTPSTNDITGNFVGIQAGENAVLDLRGGVNISSNTGTGVVLQHGSRLRIEAGTVSGNGGNGVFAQRASSIDLQGATPNIISNNAAVGLFCSDTESSFSGNTAGITGNAMGAFPPPPQFVCSGFSSQP
jgi:Right handed beta helix region